MACDAAEVAQHIGDAHIAVPFMATLDEAVLSCAHQLRMVIQYGVGVETIDIAAVRWSDVEGSSLCMHFVQACQSPKLTLHRPNRAAVTCTLSAMPCQASAAAAHLC